jgi:hypothetical protein
MPEAYYDVAIIRFYGGKSRAPIASRMSMCAMSTSSIEDVFVNIAMARPKISLRVGRCDAIRRLVKLGLGGPKRKSSK